jgi:hypothetical protein
LPEAGKKFVMIRVHWWLNCFYPDAVSKLSFIRFQSCPACFRLVPTSNGAHATSPETGFMSARFPLIAFLLALFLLAAFSQHSFFSNRPAELSSRNGQSAAPQPAPVTIKTDAPEFARLITRLSEPGGYFDTDNLISNESSYLHVMGRLRQLQLTGGAYIGVGPDQNFSYIAQLRPRLAFIVDIRRDNLLQHLWFKALFEMSRNRLEYLCLVLGKPLPANLKEWDQRPVQQLTEYIEQAPTKRELFEAAARNIRAKLISSGLTLKPEELETIRRIHESFFTAGLALRFTSHGRSPRSYYPTWRDLLLEKDLTGKQTSYLASETDFQFLKSMQQENLLIPVVGNLAGDHALRAIAQLLGERNEKVSAFYTSNVEYYLMGNDSFDRFAENVKRLPRAPESVIIRSYFGGSWGASLPQTVPGYYSTQLLQPMDSFVSEYAGGGFSSYAELISKHSLDLK